jgi:hypothetical protein
MGIGNKIATKIRTAAKTEVVPLPRPYEDVGAVVAAAVIRAAASTIGQLKLTSSTARGTDVLGIRQSRSAHVSTVSVTQRGQNTWSVTLGVPTVSGWAADWQVRVVLENGPAGVTASITTPATLTRDGTLVNKSAHGELRDLVLSGLRAGVLPGGAVEVATSKAGLASSQLEPVYTSIAAQTLRTRLQPDEILTTLALVPFPVADRQPGGLRWRLGMAGALAGYLAQASIADDGAARTVELRCPPRPSGSAVTDALVARRGIALFGAVERAMRRLDSGIERTAEPVNTQRPTAG